MPRGSFVGMADPSQLPEGVVEAGKIGSAAGLGGLVTMLVGRIFGSQDKALERVLAELKSLNTSVTNLSQLFAVMSAGVARSEADAARDRERVRELEVVVTEQGKVLERLKALVEQLSEGGG